MTSSLTNNQRNEGQSGCTELRSDFLKSSDVLLKTLTVCGEHLLGSRGAEPTSSSRPGHQIRPSTQRRVHRGHCKRPVAPGAGVTSRSRAPWSPGLRRTLLVQKGVRRVGETVAECGARCSEPGAELGACSRSTVTPGGTCQRLRLQRKRKAGKDPPTDTKVTERT